MLPDELGLLLFDLESSLSHVIIYGQNGLKKCASFSAVDCYLGHELLKDSVKKFTNKLDFRRFASNRKAVPILRHHKVPRKKIVCPDAKHLGVSSACWHILRYRALVHHQYLLRRWKSCWRINWVKELSERKLQVFIGYLRLLDLILILKYLKHLINEVSAPFYLTSLFNVWFQSLFLRRWFLCYNFVKVWDVSL
jgi:hypothetical protein